MENRSNRSNRMFAEMRKAAVVKFKNRDPKDISKKAGVPFDEKSSVFIVPTLRYNMEVAWPMMELKTPADEWYELAILHYLDMADGTALTGHMVPFGNIKDGLIRGSGLEGSVTEEMKVLLKGKNKADVEKACKAIGGKIVDLKADLSVVFPFLPRYRLALNIWFEDDEFPPSARMLVDESADHYLSIEDATIVVPIVIGEIRRMLEYENSAKLKAK